jgi:hypothetical protein
LKDRHKSFVAIIFCIIAAGTAQACDLCGCYTPQLNAMTGSMAMEQHTWQSGFYGAIGEQFTHFGTVQVNGREVGNPSGQYEDSSITQLVGGYTFNKWLAVQLNIPLIYRSFERPEGFKIDRGTESGLGDISLLGKLLLFHKESGARRELAFDEKLPHLVAREPDFTASGVMLLGIKLPSGDSSRIKEEFHEVDVPGAPPSGIHGHDLTLGTGSYDGIVGGQTSLRYKNIFLEADTQFTLRGDGRHQYHFANDLTWSAGLGYYFIRKREVTLGLQFLTTGEHKDVDRFQGKPAEDTGITSVFIGPRVVTSIGKISAEIAADLPVLIDNTALQVVPDYRLHAAISVRF